MSQDVLRIEIKKGDTLFEMEEHNRTIHRHGKEIRIYLSRNYDKKFFNTTWISSLIATACYSKKNFILTDWYEGGTNENIYSRLTGDIIGITSACLATQIENTKHQPLRFDFNSFIKTLAQGEQGLIQSSEQDFIFCAFDSNNNECYYPRPGALSTSSLSEFTEKFLRIKRDRIDRAFGIEHGDQPALFREYDLYDQEKSLAALAYELYENTYQHGNKDENGNLVEGVRTFGIKRHIFNTPEEFRRQSENFNELLHYFNSISEGKKSKNLWFYEISIIDNGIGIVKRFLASRPEYEHDSEFIKLSNFDKLNYIIRESLSSKFFSGAGNGIKNALRNIMRLNGFVSIRTNDIWAYFDGRSKAAKITPSFIQVNTQQKLEDMRGTSYSIVIPVSTG